MGITERLAADFIGLLGFQGSVIFLTTLVLTIFTFVVYKKFFSSDTKNPFSKDDIRAKEAFTYDNAKRDAVLKQGFTWKKVPENIDAIVIGSGIGGLSTAAILSKAGKKVVVLEQHDQAGGCCHTFTEKGFEFDVGIHYVGEVTNNTLTQTYIDQISDGQISWNATNEVIDRVELGVGKDRSTHDIVKGRENWRALLKKDFPNDHAAIDEFFKMMKLARKAYPITFLLKALPLWLAKFIVKSGLLSLVSDYPKVSAQSVRQYLDTITQNEKLRAALSYSYGDYGTQPDDAPIVMQALLMNHYVYGGYYPVGGASEIAFRIIPVIERSGGKVLVRAKVSEIIVKDGSVKGVIVSKGGESYSVYAPMVVSAAGIINTYDKLLPKSLPVRPHFEEILSKVQNGHGAMSIFVGLKGSSEELNLQATNTWAFSESNLDKGFNQYYKLPVDEVGKSDIPLLFISFPCTKDPLWNERYPGKSNCTIVTLANWDWFQGWEDTRINKRGEQYESLKKRIADKAWEQTCRFYPQLKDKVEYFEVGSPLSNQYYLASPKGEIYGLHHDMKRFSPETAVLLRPSTHLDGLYMTGQDITTCGFAGALYSGLLTSSVILKRNLMNDLIALTKELKSESKQSESKKN